DCILLVRGGGSFEDLMTFNDESLARAVAACPVPVVTGIGHEPDTSICDMVGDRRCSTPTAAAESVAPAITELAELLAAREHRL
ncbi:exodeoxyribonuclease VII large subunit, partial [Acinetobacter baumannii]|nr:exodeoxyribonuclease VII large subunit [Acinetobacter baumannii]